jgi:hypothetical protein
MVPPTCGPRDRNRVRTVPGGQEQVAPATTERSIQTLPPDRPEQRCRRSRLVVVGASTWSMGCLDWTGPASPAARPRRAGHAGRRALNDSSRPLNARGSTTRSHPCRARAARYHGDPVPTPAPARQLRSRPLPRLRPPGRPAGPLLAGATRRAGVQGGPPVGPPGAPVGHLGAVVFRRWDSAGGHRPVHQLIRRLEVIHDAATGALPAPQQRCPGQRLVDLVRRPAGHPRRSVRTTTVGSVTDQAALYGLPAKIRELGPELLECAAPQLAHRAGGKRCRSSQLPGAALNARGSTTLATPAGHEQRGISDGTTHGGTNA